MSTCSDSVSRSATRVGNRSRIPSVSLRGSCTAAKTLTPTARPWDSTTDSADVSRLDSFRSGMYAVRNATSSTTRSTNGSAVVGRCSRARPRIRAARSWISSAACSTRSTMGSGSWTNRANIAAPGASSIPPFGSTLQTCTQPSRIAGATARMVDQITEPLPEPVAPATRTCVPSSRSLHARASSRTPTGSASRLTRDAGSSALTDVQSGLVRMKCSMTTLGEMVRT